MVCFLTANSGCLNNQTLLTILFTRGFQIPASPNNNNDNEFNACFVFRWRHRGHPFHAIKLFCRNESDVGYAWKRGVYCECVLRRSKSEETLCRLLITMVEETFWYKKVLSRPRKADYESEEQNGEGKNSKWKVKQRKMIFCPFLIGYHMPLLTLPALWDRVYRRSIETK